MNKTIAHFPKLERRGFESRLPLHKISSVGETSNLLHSIKPRRRCFRGSPLFGALPNGPTSCRHPTRPNSIVHAGRPLTSDQRRHRDDTSTIENAETEWTVWKGIHAPKIGYGRGTNASIVSEGMLLITRLFRWLNCWTKWRTSNGMSSLRPS